MICARTRQCLTRWPNAPSRRSRSAGPGMESHFVTSAGQLQCASIRRSGRQLNRWLGPRRSAGTDIMSAGSVHECRSSRAGLAGQGRPGRVSQATGGGRPGPCRVEVPHAVSGCGLGTVGLCAGLWLPPSSRGRGAGVAGWAGRRGRAGLAAQLLGDAAGFAGRGRRSLVIARTEQVLGVIEQAVGEVECWRRPTIATVNAAPVAGVGFGGGGAGAG
jgi:hypothetical protein